MSIWLGIRHRIRTALDRRTADAETREELAYHLERQAQKHIAAGMSREWAERTAAIELGGATRWRDDTADVRTGRFIEELSANCRYAVRGMVARPWFALTALVTLAIGTGATTAIYTVVNGALLAGLPYRDPSRLVALSLRMPTGSAGAAIDMTWSYPKFAFLRDRQRSLSELSLFSPETVVITTAEGAERVPGEAVSASYFHLLGTMPVLGRGFSAAEDHPGEPAAVAIISDQMWRSRFGARQNVIGQSITVGITKHTIVGVMPPDFRGLSGDAQLWLPVVDSRSVATLASASAHNLQLVGRLGPGVALEAAKREIAAIGAELDAVYPDSERGWGAAAYSFDERRLNIAVRRSLELLSIAAVLVLVIVCVNLTTLFLTRGSGRRVELAIRLALGAGRMRVASQIMTETIVVSLIGGALGLGLATVAMRVLVTTLPVAAPIGIGSGIDFTRVSFARIHAGLPTITFAMGVATMVGALIGAFVALRVTGGLQFVSLRQGAATAVESRTARGRTLFRGGLVIAQVGLAVVLLVISGLTVESLRRTLEVPLGYRPDGLVSIKITLDPARVASDSAFNLWRDIVARVAAIPGVETAGLGDCAPIGDHCDGTTITPVGHGKAVRLAYRRASPTYFTALGTPLIRGRFFSDDDVAQGRQVAIINRAAAREIWGADDPLSTPIAGDHAPMDVVGIVDDARYGDVERPAEAAMYVPLRGSRAGLFVRVAGDAASIGPSIRAAVRAAGTGNAMANVQNMPTRLHDATARSRLTAQVFSAFALSALLLAAIGVYGTLALTVSQRSREFAIRRALGADVRVLLGIVAAQAARLAAVGTLAGIALAFFAGRAMQSVLYGVRAVEPRVYLQAAGLLAAALVCAAIMPVLRSARADPRDAMRAE